LAAPTLNASMHFMVVDDDYESCGTIAEYLRAAGYSKVTLAYDGLEALHKLDQDPSINFVISDWVMPHLNGLQLLQGVKLDPARAHITFLVISNPSEIEVEKVMKAAENLVDGYMIKPFRLHDLVEKIQEVRIRASCGTQPRIVVIDDDPGAQATIVEFLQEIGFREVRTFSSAVSGLKYLHKKRV